MWGCSGAGRGAEVGNKGVGKVICREVTLLHPPVAPREENFAFPNFRLLFGKISYIDIL